jgi:hypothetical protein
MRAGLKITLNQADLVATLLCPTNDVSNKGPLYSRESACAHLLPPFSEEGLWATRIIQQAQCHKATDFICACAHRGHVCVSILQAITEFARSIEAAVRSKAGDTGFTYSVSKLLADPSLRTLVLYHMLPSWVPSSSFVDGQALLTYAGTDVQIS